MKYKLKTADIIDEQYKYKLSGTIDGHMEELRIETSDKKMWFMHPSFKKFHNKQQCIIYFTIEKKFDINDFIFEYTYDISDYQIDRIVVDGKVYGV